TRAPQWVQGAARADPQFRHCRLSAGFEVPHFRQSMEATGNALIDEPKSILPTLPPASKMCSAAWPRDDAARHAHLLLKIRPARDLTEVQFIVGCNLSAGSFGILRGLPWQTT